MKKKFEERKTKVLALSVDRVDNHGGWINDIKLGEQERERERVNRERKTQNTVIKLALILYLLYLAFFSCAFAFLFVRSEIVGCTVDFPIVADPDRRISCLYGMLNQGQE